MKMFSKIFLCMAAISALLLTSCPNPENDGPPVSFGETLKLKNQQVWTSQASLTGFTEEKLASDLDVFDAGLGGKGGIVKGILNYTVGKPVSLEPLTADFFSGITEDRLFSDFSITQNVKAQTLALSTANSSQDEDALFFGNRSFNYNLKEMKITGSIDAAVYIYVDKDAVISASGSSVKEGELSLSAQDIKLKLKKGWNIVSVKSSFTFNIPLSWFLEPPNIADMDIEEIFKLLSGTVNIKMEVGYPADAKWILGGGMGLF